MPLSLPTPAASSPRKAVPRNRLGLAALGAVLLAMVLGAPAAAAEPPRYEGASADGTKVFFTTTERLVPGDTDGKSDVYMRDLTTGETSLVSVGQGACAAGCGIPSDASFSGATASGDEVFFRTAERLVASDTDNAPDIYMRDVTTGTGETFLVSAGEESCTPTCGNEETGATLRGVSADGSRAFLATEERLSNADTDTAIDIYARDLPSGPTELVSQGKSSCQPACGNDSAQPAVFAGSSADGSRVFFETSEGLETGDTDGAKDVYERAAGETTLISGGSAATPASVAREGGSLQPAISESGERVLFTTTESLVGAGDKNNATDVYAWEGGAPALVTSSCAQITDCAVTFEAAAADATEVLFTTTAQLSVEDEDSSADVYEQEVGGGAPTLISIGEASCAPCGNGAAPAHFDSTSPTGSNALFSTEEQLSSQDVDTTDDVYARDVGGGETTLVTPSGWCPVEKSKCKEGFVGVSGDGAHVFFQTVERLRYEDGDNESDIYERELGGEEAIRLVSTGNSPELVLGPPPPVLEGTEPESPNVSTEPRIVGRAAGGVTVQLYTTPECSGAPAATGTGAELESPGITVTVPAGSTTSFRAIAVDSEGEPSGCSEEGISYKQETPPPPPPSEGESGSGGGSGSGSGGTGGSGGELKIPGTGGGGSSGHGGGGLMAPQTTITFGPASKTRKRKVVFRFADLSGQPGTRFFCKVDRHKWGGCSSPKRVAKLKLGRHLFEVKAVNAIGVWGSAPVARKFKVVR